MQSIFLRRFRRPSSVLTSVILSLLLMSLLAAQPQLQIQPATIDFGAVEVGTSGVPRQIVLQSIGSDTVIVGNIEQPGLPFVLSGSPLLPLLLPPGASDTLEVLFQPLSADSFSDSMSIASNDSLNPSLAVLLQGRALFPGPALPGICYASTGVVDGGRLLTVDLSSGSATAVGVTGLNAVPALAINSSGDIYAGDDLGKLYRLDAQTGTAVYVGDTGVGLLPALAFNNSDELFGLGLEPVSGEYFLYRFDTATAETTAIGSAGFALFRGMAFSPLDGTLWASTATTDIYTVDPASGTATAVGQTGLFSGMPDIYFDDQGVLYGAAGGGALESNLVIIDQATGMATSVGPMGLSSVSGLAGRKPPVGITGESGEAGPGAFSLAQNYPNPFNPLTRIGYTLPRSAQVSVEVFSITGQRVETLYRGLQTAGYHEHVFGAAGLASGVYIYRLRSGSFSAVRKMILLQ